jgi:hypothetical protein
VGDVGSPTHNAAARLRDLNAEIAALQASLPFWARHLAHVTVARRTEIAGYDLTLPQRFMSGSSMPKDCFGHSWLPMDHVHWSTTCRNACLPVTLMRADRTEQARGAEVRKAIAEQSAMDAQQLQHVLEGQLRVGPPLPEDINALAEELSALAAAQRYSHSLQVGLLLKVPDGHFLTGNHASSRKGIMLAQHMPA